MYRNDYFAKVQARQLFRDLQRESAAVRLARDVQRAARPSPRPELNLSNIFKHPVSVTAPPRTPAQVGVFRTDLDDSRQSPCDLLRRVRTDTANIAIANSPMPPQKRKGTLGPYTARLLPSGGEIELPRLRIMVDNPIAVPA